MPPARPPAPHGDDPVVYLDGRCLPKSRARISPDDRGFLFGDGVYEVVRVIGGRMVDLDRHLARFARGASALALALDRAGGVAGVREAWERLLGANGLTEGEALCYAQLTRGAAPRAHAYPAADTPPTLYAFAQRIAPPDALRATGAAAVTYPDLRWARCDLKTVNLLPNVMARQAAAAAGAFESLLVRDGVVTEASHSSAFAVVGGTLRTHPLGTCVLPGVTRAAVLELAAGLGIPAREEAVTLEELRAADEAFVASTTADVMPVVTLDGAPVGAGAPGPVARALGGAMAARLGRAAAIR
ncbi:aminotransferase [Gemmatimonadetes bacterium T265]|nr:aminotransferase [Gemmatimonadetes bacterium T265]